jgi:hypothetical protein
MLGAPAMLLRPMFAAYQRGMTLQRLAHSERPSAGARDARPGRLGVAAGVEEHVPACVREKRERRCAPA